MTTILNILLSLFISVFKPNNWSRPPKKKIIIYDKARPGIVEKYLKKQDYIIFDVRFEKNFSINYYIIFKLLISFKLSLKSYKNEFIETVSPKFIISMIDHNYGFYRLKSNYPNIIFILIQFAWRRDVDRYHIPRHETNSSKKILNEIDYFLVFNDAIKEKLNKIIKANYIITGSLTNNSFKIKKKKKKFKYLLIRKNTDKNLSKKMAEGTKLQDYLSKDFDFAKKLASFIKIKGHILYILGKGFDSAKAVNFYNKLIGKKKFIYLPRKSYSYYYLDKSEIIFGTTSSLLYEAASRGCKVGFFSIKSKMSKFYGTKFGWPLKLKEKGKFWTDNSSKKEIERIFNYLNYVSSTKWKKIINSKFRNILKYDTGNSEFKKLARKIKLPLK